MNEIMNNFWKEVKQKVRFWFWHQKIKLHRFITKIREKIQEKIIDFLEYLETWAHKKLDKIYDDLYDDNINEPQIDDMVEGDTLG